MPVFIFLHILAMFIAVAMAYGPAMLMIVASRRRDVRALRVIAATSNRLGPFVGIFFRARHRARHSGHLRPRVRPA